MLFVSRLLRLGAVVSLLGIVAAYAQNSQPLAPNSDPAYQQLRNLGLGEEAVAVNTTSSTRMVPVISCVSKSG
jgi:hypothetical protein